MAIASSNVFPKVILAEQGSTPATPASGNQALFIKTADHLPYLVNSSGTVAAIGGGGGGSGLYSAYLCYQDQKAQNTAGGTFTLGAWRTRDLNTEVADTGNFGAVASNQITLAAGTYRVEASAPAFFTNETQLRLQNITDSATLATGQSSYPAINTVSLACLLVGRFTIAGTKVIELQHQCARTQTTNGYGIPNNYTTEIYATVELFKE